MFVIKLSSYYYYLIKVLKNIDSWLSSERHISVCHIFDLSIRIDNLKQANQFSVKMETNPYYDIYY